MTTPRLQSIRVSLQEPYRWSPSFIPDRLYNGIAVHGRISGRSMKPDPDKGYIVTHVSTGYSIAEFNTFDAAIEFFDIIRDWPEWQEITGEPRVLKAFENLKPRVLKAFEKAKKLELES